jgi:hypothetical protein
VFKESKVQKLVDRKPASLAAASLVLDATGFVDNHGCLQPMDRNENNHWYRNGNPELAGFRWPLPPQIVNYSVKTENEDD